MRIPIQKIVQKLFSESSRVLRNQTRLTRLTSQFLVKIGSMQPSDEILKFKTLVRMIRSFAAGRYRNISWTAIVTCMVAVVYFVNPADVIPDFIPVTGLADDFGVLMWVWNSLQNEIHNFILWEKSMENS